MSRNSRTLYSSIRKDRITAGTFSVLLLLCMICPITAYAEEPLPPEGFIEITEHLLNTLTTIEKDARNSNFNQLHNPDLQDKFDTVRTSLKEYEDHSSGTVYSWPEGRQKKIASEVHNVHFLYRAYAMTQNEAFRGKAEKSLITVQESFHEYISRVKTGKKGYINN